MERHSPGSQPLHGNHDALESDATAAFTATTNAAPVIVTQAHVEVTRKELISQVTLNLTSAADPTERQQHSGYPRGYVTSISVRL